MTEVKVWKLINKKDVSVGRWFPLEERTYKLPDGRIIDDFTVTTLSDVSMVIPFTPEGKVIMCHQFKPGADELTYEFPGGRIEDRHADFEAVAKAELVEETGIVADQVYFFGETVTFPTKASERVKNYYVLNAVVSREPEFDETENIELVYFTPSEIDEKIKTGEINTAPSLSAWLQLKLKHPELLH